MNTSEYNHAQKDCPKVYSMQGFTLIELMISLSLGLIISAAAIQVYLSFIQTESIQQSASSMQNASVFGVQSLEKSIRLANLGNPVNVMNDSSIRSGVVLSTTNLEADLGNLQNDTLSLALFTNSAGDTVGSSNEWTGISNTNTESDQLTIQYTNVTNSQLLSCDGQVIQPARTNGAQLQPAQHVIERYYMREELKADGRKVKVLACTAVVLDNFGDQIVGLDGPGEVFIEGVDHFKVLLGVRTSNGGLTYISPANYRQISVTAPATRPEILFLKLGVIVRGNIPVVTGTALPNNYSLLGQSLTLTAAAQTNNSIRRTYESSVVLRNGR